MAARRAVRDARGGKDTTERAREQVDKAKIGLGGPGYVWWKDGAPQ